MRNDHNVTLPVVSPKSAANDDSRTGRSANLSP
jgi:hypothetical protein